MQGILNTMMTVYDSVRASGSYLILLFAALYMLYRVNAKKNQWCIYYALFSLILVCANPVLVLILSKAFPVLGTYSHFLLFAPTLLYVPLAVAEIYERIRNNKQAIILVILMALVIGISGNLYGLYKSSVTEGYSYGDEQQEIIELVKEQQPMLVVADESLIPFLRTKAPEISLLYGRDLYQPGMDLGIIDVYSEELLHFYEAMKNPKDTIKDILATADMYGCDMVIVKSFKKAPAKQGHYTKTADTEQYIIYSVQ